MSGYEGKIKVRPMTLGDLVPIFAIDHAIRRTGKAVTYANLTTERIFTINRHVGRLARPVSYVDLITGDVSELLEYGLVAEIEERVRGFILGRVTHSGTSATEEGLILIVGVHPDYQRRGIATQLVNAICDKFASKGFKTVHIGIDQRDKDLIGFAEHLGFNVEHRIDYSRRIGNR